MVVEYLKIQADAMGRLAEEKLPDNEDEVDNDLGRLQAAEWKVLTAAYARRRELIPGVREALATAITAWDGEGDPLPATRAMEDKLAVFEHVFDPAMERYKLSQKEVDALIEKTKAEPADPDRDRRPMRIRLLENHRKIAELMSRGFDWDRFGILRLSIGYAKQACELK